MYIILENQTNNDGEIGTLTSSYNDKNKADSKFHQILSAAAVSSILTHSAILLTDTSKMLKNETYEHEPIN